MTSTVTRTEHYRGERLVWEGHPVEILDIVALTDSYQQVLLRLCDRPHSPPVSIPATDLP